MREFHWIMQLVKVKGQRRYSIDEYFAVEETSQVRNEYFDGEIFAMAGASLPHNRMPANHRALLRTAPPRPRLRGLWQRFARADSRRSLHVSRSEHRLRRSRARAGQARHADQPCDPH